MNIYSTINSNVSLAKEDKTPSQLNIELAHKNFGKMSQSVMAQTMYNNTQSNGGLLNKSPKYKLNNIENILNNISRKEL